MDAAAVKIQTGVAPVLGLGGERETPRQLHFFFKCLLITYFNKLQKHSVQKWLVHVFEMKNHQTRVGGKTT